MTQNQADQPPLPPEQRVGYAVVGIGQLTQEELLPAFGTAKRSRLAAFVTGEKAQMLPLARGQGLTEADVYSYDEFEQLAGRDDVQAIYIVTPNDLHREFTERAAKIGKHVLCEKPMSVSVTDAEAMVQACQSAGVKLMVAYRCQYAPQHWAARELIQGGQLGDVRVLSSVNGQLLSDPSSWRLNLKEAGGGPLPDVGLYSINTARFWLGVEPTEVFAYTYQPTDDPRFKQVEESVTWIMRFPNGVTLNCVSSYDILMTRTLRAVGPKGSVYMNPAFDYAGLKLEVGSKDGETVKQIKDQDQFTLEIDHFSACIQEDKTPFTPGEEGVQDHRIMAAIYESARTGRPVSLQHYDGQDVFRGSKPEGH
ncbi:Gfo/Idh/MocA family oxidoreductase [Deinococcus sp.]|uniref:Gfo/Idh/MocA family oxidoreductase n=1 Tax=Deinococcus sp. TaxID=47478 RepID=UPI003B5C01F4